MKKMGCERAFSQKLQLCTCKLVDDFQITKHKASSSSTHSVRVQHKSAPSKDMKTAKSSTNVPRPISPEAPQTATPSSS